MGVFRFDDRWQQLAGVPEGEKAARLEIRDRQLEDWLQVATGPTPSGFRNVIINGDFRINQRQATSGGNAAFIHDRWYLSANLTGGSAASYSTQTFSLGSPAASGYESQSFARVATSSMSGASNWAIFVQRVEDVRTLAGTQVTVSFWAKAASGTPGVHVELSQLFGQGGAPSTNVDWNFGRVTLSTTWRRYSVTGTLPSIAGKTLGTTVNTSQLLLGLWCSGGSDWNTRTDNLGHQNNTFDFWGVQIERGTEPSPFEERPLGTELALCQRYYRRTATALYGEGTVFGYSVAGTAIGQAVAFPVEMRAAPIVTAGGAWGLSNTAAIQVLTSASGYFPYVVPVVTGHAYALPNNTGWLTFDAELIY